MIKLYKSNNEDKKEFKELFQLLNGNNINFRKFKNKEFFDIVFQKELFIEDKQTILIDDDNYLYNEIFNLNCMLSYLDTTCILYSSFNLHFFLSILLNFSFWYICSL